MNTTLLHFHDPMCSWCWAFKPTWLTIQSGLDSDIEVQHITGGLAPDSDTPMPESMKTMLQGTWQRIEQTVPGTRFNYAFWTDTSPRRSTYPACRAVVAARLLDPGREQDMITGIQHAYYLNARNPSNNDVLIDVATQVGFDRDEYAARLTSDEVQTTFEQDLSLAARTGAQGFPSLFLTSAITGPVPIPVDYNNAHAVISRIHETREALAKHNS